MSKRLSALGMVSAVVAIILSVMFFVSPAYAVETDEQSASYSGGTYVSIGDSIAAGFNISSHLDAGGKPIEGSFANLVSEALDMEEIQLAYPGFRTNELLRALGGNWQEDAYADFAQASLWKTLNWSTYPDQMISSVRQADLLTLEVGGNDLFTTPIYTALLDVMEKNAVTDEQKAAVDFLTGDDTTLANFSKVVVALQEMGCYEEFAEELIDQLKISTTSFRSDYDEVLSILDKECSGTVMILGLYNPYSSITVDLSDDVSLKLGAAFSAAIADYNLFVRYEAMKYGFTYVNIANTTSFASDKTNLISALSSDIHPNAEGHELIAQAILDALPRRFGSSAGDSDYSSAEHAQHTSAHAATREHAATEPVNHSWQVSEVIKPTRLAAGYTRYTCSDCGETVEWDFVPKLTCTSDLSGRWLWAW